VRVSAGPVADLPTDRCTSVGDGSVVVVRTAEGVVAFGNRCLHRDSALAGGRVQGGRLTCPQHFWQYDLRSGRHVGGRGTLPSFPVEVTPGGEVVVEVPDPAPPMSMRERLLAHARDWERGA
jgi:nitrite reductase/ring-hydroxylating ferredoxin subunit